MNYRVNIGNFFKKRDTGEIFRLEYVDYTNNIVLVGRPDSIPGTANTLPGNTYVQNLSDLFATSKYTMLDERTIIVDISNNKYVQMSKPQSIEVGDFFKTLQGNLKNEIGKLTEINGFGICTLEIPPVLTDNSAVITSLRELWNPALYLKLDPNSLIIDGNGRYTECFMIRTYPTLPKDSSIVEFAIPKHTHKPKEYVGLMDRFMYCEDCGEKI